MTSLGPWLCSPGPSCWHAALTSQSYPSSSAHGKTSSQVMPLKMYPVVHLQSYALEPMSLHSPRPSPHGSHGFPAQSSTSFSSIAQPPLLVQISQPGNEQKFRANRHISHASATRADFRFTFCSLHVGNPLQKQLWAEILALLDIEGLDDLERGPGVQRRERLDALRQKRPDCRERGARQSVSENKKRWHRCFERERRERDVPSYRWRHSRCCTGQVRGARRRKSRRPTLPAAAQIRRLRRQSPAPTGRARLGPRRPTARTGWPCSARLRSPSSLPGPKTTEKGREEAAHHTQIYPTQIYRIEKAEGA
jgi:hypothetical protein